MIPVDAKDRRDAQTAGVSARERLPLLYQGMLTVIVRIQSGKQQLVDAGAFQKRMEGLLDEIAREAVRVGYSEQEIQDAHCVVVALLDETVRRSNDPHRAAWTPLLSRRCPPGAAGQGVFDRLRAIRSRPGSGELADLLEIYVLCFLLGYEGQFAGRQAEMNRLIEILRRQMESFRELPQQLSPEGRLPAPPPPAEPPSPPPDRWKAVTIVCATVAFLSWMVLKVVLMSYARGALKDLLAH